MSSWNKKYEKQSACYPDNMLIRFIAKHYYNSSDRKKIRILDVGCGTGASSWFLAREGFSVAAIDGSLVAIEKIKDRLTKERLEAFLACGDITQLEFKSDFFDAIIDINSLCYIQKDKIEGVMQSLFKVLKPGGRIFSMSPADNCSKLIFNEIEEATFQNYLEIKQSFNNFSDVKINTLSYDLERGEDWQHIHLWIVEAVKNE